MANDKALTDNIIKIQAHYRGFKTRKEIKKKTYGDDDENQEDEN